MSFLSINKVNWIPWLQDINRKDELKEIRRLWDFVIKILIIRKKKLKFKLIILNGKKKKLRIRLKILA